MSKITSQQQATPVAVIIGRFNPPTIGHYAMFRVVKKFIKNNPEMKLHALPVVVVVSGKETSKDLQRNPLNGEDRIKFMQASGMADGVLFVQGTDAISGLNAVREAGYEPTAVAAGSDRDQYKGLLDKYFTTPEGGTLKHYDIRIQRNDISADAPADSVDAVLQFVEPDMPISLVSGTLARAAVKAGDLEKFMILTGTTDKPDLAQMMFDKIKTSTETDDVTSG